MVLGSVSVCGFLSAEGGGGVWIWVGKRQLYKCAKFDCQNHRDFLGNFEAGVGLNGISLGFHDIVSGCCMLLLFLFRVPWA